MENNIFDFVRLEPEDIDYLLGQQELSNAIARQQIVSHQILQNLSPQMQQQAWELQELENQAELEAWNF